ncbi:glycoside hydrolase family 79 protein [Polychaeton citri CBS 116435]|uniref:Glycoside hydrolase family 79 protein n=1 Tax=Polychaeton citri CBS 116435 TaxID=1314669 RepID=A0A9P4UPM2_9PEZI|nr:glycoside hydrolase family 79 protein [Polychaeton citri CBS 116435]
MKLSDRNTNLPLALAYLAVLQPGIATAYPPSSPRRHSGSGNDAFQLQFDASPSGASIPHSNSFSSFSFEPAFWVEFFGNASAPNELAFSLLGLLVEHGSRPIVRPGGITMDSMIFDASAGDPVRTTDAEGGVYRTTFGPAFYQSWNNFPASTRFVSTLNFGNDSLDIARDLAVASVKYQSGKVSYFELGNEPTNYPSERWDNSTDAYVAQWLDWTAAIDTAVDIETVGLSLPKNRWWASSATTDVTGLHVRPVDLIPADIDRKGQVAEYSIHSYAFATCDPARAALATIPNILNHTELTRYAVEEIYPSARAALDAGTPWIIGEFNSIACSGAPNVSDTFAQALWTVDVQLIYASLNASSVHLHQGATLVFQSGDQVNSAGDDGTPGFSTYDFVYPIDSPKRGEARALPSFAGLLYLAEAFASNSTRVRVLDVPEGIDGERFSAYALYNAADEVSKLAIINMNPLYQNSTDDFSVRVDLSALVGSTGRDNGWFSGRSWFGSHASDRGRANRARVSLKRMTAQVVDEKDSQQVTWAGQSFKDGSASGKLQVESVGQDGIVTIRGSEAVLIFFDQDEVYGL